MATSCLVSTGSHGEYSIRFSYLSKWHPINVSHSQHFCLGLETKENVTWLEEGGDKKNSPKRTNSMKAKIMSHLSSDKELRKYNRYEYKQEWVQGTEVGRGNKILHSNFIVNSWSQKSHEVSLCLQPNNQLLFVQCTFGCYTGYFINISLILSRRSKK